MMNYCKNSSVANIAPMRENVFYTVNSCVFVADHTPEYSVV